ncbi:MAG: glycosyltransferase [Ruminococcaceae bacterium]|nr:glycosyltransferase [Oscillospiraceae bacterium]
MKINNTNGKIIFYIAHIELPDINALAHRVLANCIALREAGYRPILIGYSKDKSTSRDIEKTHFVVNGFDCYNIPYPISNMDWAKDAVEYRKIKKFIENFFVEGVHSIVCCSIGSTNFYGLMRFAKKHGIHMVSDTEDWFDKFTGNIIRRTYKKLDEEVYVKILKPIIKNVITISPFLYDYYTKVQNCNCIIVPSLSSDTDVRFKNLPEYVVDDKLKFVFSGNPGYRGSKDRIDWCVRAFAHCAPDNAVFDIFGVAKDDFIEQFPEYEIEARDPKITFHGFCDNRTCLEKIAVADFTVFARLLCQVTMAGFPTKFSESLNIGIPSITTPTSDLTDYISNGVNGLISEEATYESFEKTFKIACSLSKEEIARIHENCRNDKRLDCKYYTQILKDYFDNLY